MTAVLRMLLDVAILAAFTAVAMWSNGKASRYQAAAKARGLTTHGADVQSAKSWMFVSVLGFLMAATLVPISWKYTIDTYNPQYWLKVGSLSVDTIMFIGGLQWTLRRRKSIMNSQQ